MTSIDKLLAEIPINRKSCISTPSAVHETLARIKEITGIFRKNERH